MSIEDVVVNRREKLGKEESNRLRKSGLIPSVVYGLGGESVPVSVEPKAITRIIRSERGLNTVLNLQLAGTDQTRHVLIKDVTRHPITDRLTHVDFIRIDMSRKVTVTIPIHIEGTPEGVKFGGVLTIVRHEVEVEALPNQIPGSISADVTHLGLDQALRIGDLPQIDGVTYTLGANRTVAVVHAEKEPAVVDDAEEA